jgi:hypothetical protein
MLGNSLTATVSTVAHVLVNIGSSAPGSTSYQLTDSVGKWTLQVRHQFNLKGGRNRCNVSLRLDKYSADPLVPAQNVNAYAVISSTCDFPSNGFTPTEVTALYDGLRTLADATLMGKVVNGET